MGAKTLRNRNRATAWTYLCAEVSFHVSQHSTLQQTPVTSACNTDNIVSKPSDIYCPTFLHIWMSHTIAACNALTLNLLPLSLPLISSPLRPFPMLRADAAACEDNSCAGLVVIVIGVVGERAVNVGMAMVAVAVVVW
jgi:hypothetical protein